MPAVRLRILAALLASAFVVIPSSNFLIAQRSAIDTYAITNARVITVAGPILDHGTVVVRDGLIAAVGANVTAPADARVIDGTGLTVYPGLIDSSTALGMPQPSPTPTPSPGGAGVGFGQFRPQTSATSALNSTQPPGLQPEVLAEDFIKPGGDQIEAARNAGITTALTASRQGIWMGQSALINLAGDTTQQMIVRSPVALHVGFTPLRTGNYPNSLMGVFASLRQMLLDAQRYRQALQIYERSPRGMRRPSQDRSLAALLPVLDGTMPVVMYADREREIGRALDLAQEFKLRPIIAGGLEAGRVTDRLRQSKVPVLLSLNFPRRTTAALPEADAEPVRILRERVEAPKTAAKLVAARVSFAFQSGALTNMADFSANLIRAIENGLSRDDALRALTLWPAQILGVADRLGTIEAGKIANLTITRGDLFDRNPRISYVFIDGRSIDLRSETGGIQAGAATGTWTLNVNLGSGDAAVTLVLQQEGERLRGSIQGDLGSSEIANASTGAGGDVRFTVPITFEGQTAEATFAGRISGNEMQGTMTVVGRAPGSFTGTKAGAPAQPAPSPTPPGELRTAVSTNAALGTWIINLMVGLQTFPGTLKLDQSGTAITGLLQSPFGTTKLTGGSIDAHGFRFIAREPIAGRMVDMAVDGSADGNEIRGTVRSEIGFARFIGTRQR
ncbi:MAG: amidohydrolase family protein [Pyrinomonadaceae bacterium]|nr:amidohydrolase family protein [Pyrinomonadaceae bacterium]